MSWECPYKNLQSEICKDSLRRQYGDKDKDWSDGLTDQESQATPKSLQKLKKIDKEIRKEGWERGRKDGDGERWREGGKEERKGREEF